MWLLPAVLLTIAGYRLVFDRPPAPLVATYIDVSRALVPLLAAFTAVVCLIWLVRTERLTSWARGGQSQWRHGQAAVLAVAAFAASLVSADAAISTRLAGVAAGFGFVGLLAMPRWLLHLANTEDRVVAGWIWLLAMVGFELTIGWFHSALTVDGASVFSGFVVLLRGVVLLAASAAVVAPSAMEHVRINGQQLRRILG